MKTQSRLYDFHALDILFKKANISIYLARWKHFDTYRYNSYGFNLVE